MMNAIPGKFSGKLASPFLLVHGSGHNKRTWFPLFSICYFHHKKDGDVPHSHCQSHTMDGIAINCSPMLNCWCTIRGRSNITSPTPIVWILITSLLWFILLSTMMVDSFALCFGMKMCRLKNCILRVRGLSDWTLPQICFLQVRL